MSDRAKFKFIERVLADPELSLTAKCIVTSLLLSYRNARTGQCNPSLSAIAESVSATRRAVISAVAELRRSGWVEIVSTSGGSQRNTNRYRFDFDRCKSFTGGVNETHGGVNETTHEPLKNPTSLRDVGEGVAARRRAADAAPPEVEAAWAEFSQLWARGHPDDPDKVRKCFIKAAADHGTEAILASARRWAAAREPQYLPKPEKWLAGGWQAEPPAEKSSSNGAGPIRRAGRKPTAAEVGFEHYAKARAKEEGR